jgi:hypothetical protein
MKANPDRLVFVIRPTAWSTWFWALGVNETGAMVIEAFGEAERLDDARSELAKSAREFLAKAPGAEVAASVRDGLI